MKRAILIGSAKFDTDSGIESLRFPANDVKRLASVLQSDGFNFEVSEIIDEPSYHVSEQLEKLISGAGFDDFILIYFSGHGKLNAKGELFLSCRNTKQATLNTTGLKYTDVTWLLDVHGKDRVAIILDCCYAGRAVGGLKGSIREQAVSALETGRGMFVFAASGATQTAQERELEGHGVFTAQIIEGLTTGEADLDKDGQISLRELAMYVEHELVRKGIGQRPETKEIVKSGALIIGTNRRAALAKIISSMRLTADSVRIQVGKSRYRSIEDYLDELSGRSDFDRIPREHKFESLQLLHDTGSLEGVFRSFSDAEQRPSDRSEQVSGGTVSSSSSAPRASVKVSPQAKRHAHDQTVIPWLTRIKANTDRRVVLIIGAVVGTIAGAIFLYDPDPSKRALFRTSPEINSTPEFKISAGMEVDGSKGVGGWINNLKNVSRSDCQQFCAKTENCRAFGFEKASRGCYLYLSTTLKPNEGWDSGVRISR